MIMTILNCKDHLVAHFGLTCGSWVVTSRGSTLRHFLAPMGFFDFGQRATCKQNGIKAGMSQPHGKRIEHEFIGPIRDIQGYIYIYIYNMFSFHVPQCAKCQPIATLFTDWSHLCGKKSHECHEWLQVS